jgi:hypothetical protein
MKITVSYSVLLALQTVPITQFSSTNYQPWEYIIHMSSSRRISSTVQEAETPQITLTSDYHVLLLIVQLL